MCKPLGSAKQMAQEMVDMSSAIKIKFQSGMRWRYW